MFTEEQDFYRPNYPRGQRATVGGAGVVTRQGTLITLESDLSPEDILWPLHCGIVGNQTPTVGPPKVWTFTPVLTAWPTLDSATIELVLGDGATNHYAREFGYALCRSMDFRWSVNEVAKLKTEWIARATQTSTPTAALTLYTGRESLVSNLLSVYRDTTWAGLGGTQLTGLIRSASLKVNTGLDADYTLDGRSDKDFTQHKVAAGLGGTLSLVLEFDSTGAARSFTDYRSNLIEYIRLKNVGATAANSIVQIDGAFRFTSPPSLSYDGEVVLVSCDMEAVYDDTGSKIFVFTITNSTAAL